MNEQLIQGSDAWKELRKTKITATDAPIIMNVSAYRTSPYKLWINKLGFGQETYEHNGMKEGKELEIVARDLFIKETGIMMVPEVVFSDKYDYMMSSLDGIDFDKQNILEIKCIEKFHQMALDGVVPECFMPQLQHQMITTGLKKCYYMSYTPLSFKILEVYLDESQAQNLILQEQEFYKCLQELIPPSFTELDYIQKNDPEWIQKAERLKEISKKRKEMEREEDILKKQLIELAGSSNAKGAGISVSKVIRQGAIDYKNINELKGVDLTAHRKPNTVYYRIS